MSLSQALFENPHFAPRIRRFCVPANTLKGTSMNRAGESRLMHRTLEFTI